MTRKMAPVEEQLYVLMSGVDYGDAGLYKTFSAELKNLLEEDRPLKVYLGIDPTASSLTLGHAVPLRKLSQFQQFGHSAIFLIGDATALIGDPSDKNKLRPQLTSHDIKANEEAYFSQATKFLHPKETDLRHNSEWLSELKLTELIEMLSDFTVAEMLSRDNFKKRQQSKDAIYLHEFLYSLMQGYDAMALDCDVQVGGTEQLFNLMAGRKIQTLHGQRKHVPITMPILVGLDGKARMSKSLGNFIGLDDEPFEQFGKVMSIPDSAIPDYLMLATSRDRREVEKIIAELESGIADPMEEKQNLALTIVEELHSSTTAKQAAEYFKQTVQKRQEPDEIPEFPITDNLSLINILTSAKLTESRRAAKRLLSQGAISIDGNPVSDENLTVAPGSVIRVGKRRWIRLIEGS